MSLAAERVKAVRKRDGHYWLDGEKYVAVTEVLSVINKKALIHWAAIKAAGLVLSDPDTYDSAEKAASGIYGIRDAAAGRGSTIHSLAEALGRGAEIHRDDVPEQYRGYADAFISWVAQTKPTPLFTEANVYSTTHKYAGTTDLIAAFPDKQIRLIDYKTGKDIYAEVGLQMAAYRNCDFILPHVGVTKYRPAPIQERIGNEGPTQEPYVVHEPISMPPVAECAVVLLNENGTFKYETIAGDFEAFLHAKALWEWWKR